MEIIYDKTIFEKLLDALEDSFKANRPIKSIKVTSEEWKQIAKRITDVPFLTSINHNVVIKDFELMAEPNTTTKVRITYFVRESNTIYTAVMKHILIYVL